MSVEIENTDLEDPAASPLKHFGQEVKLERELLGLSRIELGKQASCGYSMVAKIEAGERMPSLHFAQSCDRTFPYANGRFERLWPLVIKYAYPSWFRPYVEMESVAAAIRSFEGQLVPGLLQTPDYARAVLAGGRLGERAEEMVAARLERQRVLSRENPPDLWVVMHENVLRMRIGSPAVLTAQFAKLLETAETDSTVIQIVPYEAGAHAGLDGPFTVLTMVEGPDVVYVDSYAKGQVLADPTDVRKSLRAYDLLQAVALSPQASLDLIHTTVKELKR